MDDRCRPCCVCLLAAPFRFRQTAVRGAIRLSPRGPDDLLADARQSRRTGLVRFGGAEFRAPRLADRTGQLQRGEHDLAGLARCTRHADRAGPVGHTHRPRCDHLRRRGMAPRRRFRCRTARLAIIPTWQWRRDIGSAHATALAPSATSRLMEAGNQSAVGR